MYLFMKSLRFCIFKNVKNLLIIALLLIIPLFNIFSQDIDLTDKIINKIYFKGLKKAKPKDLEAILLSEEGKLFDLDLVNQDYQNLFSLGYFDDIIISTEIAYDKDTNQVIPGVINLIFEFIEKPTIRKIIFRGNKALSFATLRDKIIIKRGSFLDESAISTDIYAIKEQYKEKGFNNIEINHEIYIDEELKSKGKVDLIYVIDEGIETYVSEIIFSGNDNVSDFTLKNKIKTKEKKFLGLQKGIFTESLFYQDIEDIKTYYRDLGYYLVEILEPEIIKYEIIEEEEKKELIRINIHINEGNQYEFGGVVVEGNKVVDTEDILYGIKIRKGQVFNFSKYQEFITSIHMKYTNKGYIDTQIIDRTEIDEENKLINAFIEIKESKRSYIEAIYFKGNEKTKDYIMKRAVETEPGEIFNSNKLMSSIMKLYNLGYFTSVEQDIQAGSAPGLLVITYVVEEQKTAEVRFGLSIPISADIGSIPNISIFAEVNEKNLLGRQLNIRAKVEGSITKQGFDLSFDDPWFFNYPISLGASFNFYHNWIRRVYRDCSKEIEDDDYEDWDEAYDEWTDEYDTTEDYKNPLYLGYGYANSLWDMGLQNLTTETAVTAGYRFLKYFGVSGRLSCEPIYTWIQKPQGSDFDGINYGYSQLDLDSLSSAAYFRAITANNGWSVRNRISATFSISTTKRAVNPFQGIRFNFNAAYIFGNYDAFTLNSKFTAYFKILDVDFGDWAFKNVLVFNAAASFIFPGFRNLARNGEVNGEKTYGAGPIIYGSDYLIVDGLFSGRGWSNQLGSYSSTGDLSSATGFVKLDFSLEYRVPIHERIVWLAAFIDFVNLVKGPVKITDSGNEDTSASWIFWNYPDNPYYYEPLGIDNWYGSIGVGIEFTFPQLPLSFFIVKRFKLNYYSGIQWLQDSSYSQTGYLDFVLSIVGYYF